MCNTKISGYPSIDKPWLKYYSSEALHAQPASCTVYQNIYQHNKEHLSETALEYFGVKITFSKLFEHVESCAKALLRYAFSKKGESIHEYRRSSEGTDHRTVPRK